MGQRIRLAVEATRKAVGQNTNLGIVLLAAPLANAAFTPGDGDLESRLRHTLQGLSVDDAREAYRAIRETKPGGLGDASEHDVASEPDVTLLEAMRAAETRDRIAWNYAHGFADIFTLGLKWLAHARERWAEPSWAVTRVYLGFLAHLPDTLIERKFGTRTATLVREEAGPIEASFTECQSPEAMTAPLAAFDRALEATRSEPRHLGRSHRGDTVRSRSHGPRQAGIRPENCHALRRTIDLPISQPPAYVLPAEL